MENPGLINKINSSYILKDIFNYIKDKNFKMKLFFYSKSFQNRLGIKIDYKIKYLEKIGFNIDEYLDIDEDYYKKDILTHKYNKFLFENKLDKEKFQNILYEVLENKKYINEEITIIKGSDKFINIESPLFEKISKIKNFGNNYTINISQKNIDKYNLKDFYANIFEKLNKSNINYSSIFYSFEEIKKIDYLKELNIDFNKIKRICLIESDIFGNVAGVNEDEVRYFFETLFSFNNIINNLICLKIYFNPNKESKLDYKLFENINNFKSLRYLFIYSLDFDKIITI